MSVPEGTALMSKVEDGPDFAALDNLEAASTQTGEQQEQRTGSAQKAPASKADSAAHDDEDELLGLNEPTKPEAKDATAATDQAATAEAKGVTGNEWEQIKQEFPSLTVTELRNLRDKAKNLEAGFTPKFQKVKAMAEELQAREKQFAEKFGQYDPGDVEEALKIVKAVGGDPALQARLQKAFNEVEVGADDIANVQMARLKREQDARFRDLEAKAKAYEETIIRRQQEERENQARQVAEKYGLDWEDYDVLLGKEHARLAANGQVDESFDWNKFFVIAAKKLQEKEETKFKTRLEKYKADKRAAAKVTPIGARGGSAPVITEAKEPETADERVGFLEKLLRGGRS